MEPSLQSCLAAAGLTPKGVLEPLSGGDIAAVYRLATDRGGVVVKRDAAERLAGRPMACVPWRRPARGWWFPRYWRKAMAGW